MELKEMVKVMQHYADGGGVEVRLENNNRDNWRPANNPSWNWKTYDYRIKEPKQKIIIQKWLCRNGQGDYVIIEYTNVNQYKTYEKVKLIKSYEVEL